MKPPPELKIVNGEVIKSAMLPCLTLKPTYLQHAALVGCGRRTTPKQCCGRHCLASPDNKSTLVMRSGLVSGGEFRFETEKEEQQFIIKFCFCVQLFMPTNTKISFLWCF